MQYDQVMWSGGEVDEEAESISKDDIWNMIS